MKLAIVTGASKGLGAALAGRLHARGYKVLGLARSTQPAGALFDWASVDLADLPAAAAAVETWLDPRDVDEALLVLNAGMVEPVAGIAELQPADLAAHVGLNLTAPMALSAAFLRATADWPAERRILAISSGASRRATAYWAAYTASKSGLDGFVRAINAEYMDAQGPRVSAVALAPGIIDTGMQETIRAKDFPTVSRYRGLKERGELMTADEAAARVEAYLDRPDFGSVELDDVRNYD